MEENVKNEYPEEYKRIKSLGYETVEKRKILPNLNTGIHFHPFTACMIILEGSIVLNQDSKKVILNQGDFISVDENKAHDEKTDIRGATVLYGKKFNGNRRNLALVNDSLNTLYLGDNNKLISFITKSPVSHILYLTLYKQFYSEIWHTQEDILNLIPKKYGSRSTIINLINDGVDREYILKKITHSDKRSVYYELEKEIFQEIEEWVQSRELKLLEMFKT
jgi:hypothetical protein